MKKQMNLKKTFNIKTKDKIIIIIIINLVLSMFFLHIFNKKSKALLLDYSVIKATEIANNLITTSVNDKEYNIDEYFVITKNNDNEILSVDFNNNLVNKRLYEINNIIESKIIKLQTGTKGNIFFVPFGVIITNAFTSDLGPKIPVKMLLKTSITSFVNTTVDDYGINNALMKINVNVELTQLIVLPFASKKVIVKSSVPLVTKIINGKIPQYYGGNITSNSPLNTLPRS